MGTSSLTNEDGSLSRSKVKAITQQLAMLHEAGHELILVSSGAIAAGFGKGIDGDPHKRWSMWFNSKQREEPYQVLTSL